MSASLVQLDPGLRVSPKEAATDPPSGRLRLLRLSITDRCNFRCRYCMPQEGVAKVAHSDLLPLESLVEQVRWLVAHSGIDRVRLTGGEPLMRAGVDQLIAGLLAIAGIREVSLTTNGSLLPRMAWDLKAAGLGRVNISLDSLDKERFAEVTRGASLQSTLAGIAAAWEAGLTPIKLNTVLRRSTWRLEVPSLLDYAAETGIEIRFIELMRTGTERAWCEAEFVSVDEVCAGLGVEVVPAEEQTRASALRTLVNWHGTQVAVGWITPRSHPFCSRCDRLRMDARGRIRRCLMDPVQLDLSCLLKSMDNSAARREFEFYISGKVPPRSMDSALAMSQIGG
jgi:cyclic pyranopterin phosphate synthase